jgi:hypothetical protein
VEEPAKTNYPGNYDEFFMNKFGAVKSAMNKAGI